MTPLKEIDAGYLAMLGLSGRASLICLMRREIRRRADPAGAKTGGACAAMRKRSRGAEPALSCAPRRLAAFALASLLALPPAPATAADRFLEALAGRWIGRAEQTPLGPLPYDLTFERAADGSMSATAAPGAALHHWRFSVDDGALVLRFLSTFRGNTEPLWFRAGTPDGFAAGGASSGPGTVRFTAAGPAAPVLEATLSPDALSFDIFLSGRPHVSIRLRRPGH